MTKNIEDRKRTHKLSLNTNNPKYDRKVYKFIRENDLDFNKLTFKVLKDNLPDKETAEKWETTFMIFYNSIDNGTNTYYSAFTNIRRKEKNKSFKMKNYKHIWYENNKEKNKEKNQDQKKNYRTENREKIQEQRKKYYIKNKEKINEYTHQWGTQKINCPLCNLQMNKSSLIRHIRRKHK